MPQIYKYLKLIFSFVASGEHLPVHVHVIDENNNQTIFDLVIKNEILVDIKTRKKEGFDSISEKNQRIAKAFIRRYYADIVTKWFEFFILGKKIKSETVKEIENLIIDTKKLTENLRELNKHFYPTEKKQPKTNKTPKSKKK